MVYTRIEAIWDYTLNLKKYIALNLTVRRVKMESQIACGFDFPIASKYILVWVHVLDRAVRAWIANLLGK